MDTDISRIIGDGRIGIVNEPKQCYFYCTEASICSAVFAWCTHVTDKTHHTVESSITTSQAFIVASNTHAKALGHYGNCYYCVTYPTTEVGDSILHVISDHVGLHVFKPVAHTV